MDRIKVDYKCGDVNCKGYFVYNEIVKEPRPGILIAHAWMGQDAFAKEKADALAKLGFVAFVADLYGNGQVVESKEEAAELMQPLFINRQLLRNRIVAAFDAFKEQELLDKKNIGAIGFCFGGLTVIELLKSGVDVKGVVSFHGLLGPKMGNIEAELVPSAEKIDGSLLILHGYNDPMVSEEDIKNTQKECNAAGIDWQMHTYGHAYHAFTNPDAKEPDAGLQFNEKASIRSWQAMRHFFQELFSH